MESIDSREKDNEVIFTPYRTYILFEALEHSFPRYNAEYVEYEPCLDHLQELVEGGGRARMNFSSDVSDEKVGFFALALENYQSAVQDFYDEPIEYPITFRKWLQRFVERRTIASRLSVVNDLKELFIQQQTRLMLENIDQQNT